MSTTIKAGDIIELKIDRMAFGGNGVGRHEGLAVFVSDTAPEETVRACVTLKKKNYAEAKLIEVLSSSQYRVEPKCKFAKDCGGCTWQHITYQEQLNQKQNIVKHALKKWLSTEDIIRPIIPSPNEYRYRNRIQVRVSQKEGLGYFKKGSNQIVAIDDCLIADEKLTQQFNTLKKQYGLHAIDKVELALTSNNEVIQSTNREHGEEFGFTQVNSATNEKMLEFVLEKLKDFKALDVLELYSGNGNFTEFLLKNSTIRTITSIEINSAAVESAKARLQHFIDAKKATCICDDALKWIRKNRNFLFDFVLLDPPRIGCDKQVLEAIHQQNPGYIIYVSCNPITFARDVEVLCSSNAFQLLEVQPLDMFPHTSHVELIAVLKRIK